MAEPYPLDERPELVLHAAAWTKVDDAEADPEGARQGERRGDAKRGRAGGTRRLLLDRLCLRRPQGRAVRRERPAEPARCLRADEARGGAGGPGRLDRPIVVALRLDGPQLRANDAPARLGAGRGVGGRRPAWLARPMWITWRSATRGLLDRPYGVYHVAAEGDCTWADFAEAIFEEAGLDCRVNRITAADFGAPAPRPAYSVLRSEKGAPALPHWREGLRACLARLSSRNPSSFQAPGLPFLEVGGPPRARSSPSRLPPVSERELRAR